MKKIFNFIFNFFTFLSKILNKSEENVYLINARVLHKKYGFGTIYFIDKDNIITLKLDCPITESTDSKSVYIIATQEEFFIIT